MQIILWVCRGNLRSAGLVQDATALYAPMYSIHKSRLSSIPNALRLTKEPYLEKEDVECFPTQDCFDLLLLFSSGALLVQ